MFVDPWAFARLVKNNAVICLTATIPHSDLDAFEGLMLDKLQLESFNYAPKALPQSKKLTIDRELEIVDDADLIEKIKEITENQPVLFFTYEDKAQMLASRLAHAVRVTVETPSAVLTECDKPTSAGGYSTFLVSDAQLLRGSDYRAPSTGICLIIGRGVQSERDKE
jgi:hypothetical protein